MTFPISVLDMPPTLLNVMERMQQSLSSQPKRLLVKKDKKKNPKRKSSPQPQQDVQNKKKVDSRIERLIAAKRRRKLAKKKKKKAASDQEGSPTSQRGYSCLFCSEPRRSHEQYIQETSHYVALDCEFVGVGPRKLSALGNNEMCNLYLSSWMFSPPITTWLIVQVNNCVKF